MTNFDAARSGLRSKEVPGSSKWKRKGTDLQDVDTSLTDTFCDLELF